MATNLTPPPAEDAVPPGGSAHAENTFPAQIQDEEKYWTEIPSEGGERQQFSAPRDWFAEYDAATKPERVTEANAPSWVLRMCAKKNLPLEGMASRDWHPARFEGRKNTALIIPCVVNGQFVGIQKWYDPEHAPPNNRKNRWTQKDPDQAFYNIGMIHDPDIDAPIYMLESPTDALSGDTAVIAASGKVIPKVHRIVTCCGATNMTAAARMLNVEFPDRRLVIIAQSEDSAEKHAKIIGQCEQAAAAHPDATILVCPEAADSEGNRIKNDLNDMWLDDRYQDWGYLLEALQPVGYAKQDTSRAVVVGDDAPSLPVHPEGHCAMCGDELAETQRKTRRWCNDNCKTKYRALERTVQKRLNRLADVSSRRANHAAMAHSDTAGGLQDALGELGVELRWNIRSNIVEVNDTRHGKDFQPLSELHEARLQTDVWENVLTPDEELWREQDERWSRHTKSILFGYQTDPFRDWLDALIADPAIPLLDESANSIEGCFDIPDDIPGEYCLWVSKLGFDEVIAMAEGIERSGQIVPVFYSALQGIGKSAFWAFSFPEEYRRHWFSDSFNWTASDADIAGLAGVFCECQEMGNMPKAGRERVKAIITAEFSRVRFPYDRRFTDITKRSLVVCTDNRKRCLPADETGNRRFAPITLLGTKNDISRIIDWWAEHRLSWWKTRAKAVREGRGMYRCPPGLQRTWERMLEEHRWQHPDEQKALDWLEDNNPAEVMLEELIYAADIRDETGGPRDNKERFTEEDRRNAAKALRSLGFEDRRVFREFGTLGHQKRVRVWVKPQEVPKKPTGGRLLKADQGKRQTLSTHTLKKSLPHTEPASTNGPSSDFNPLEQLSLPPCVSEDHETNSVHEVGDPTNSTNGHHERSDPDVPADPWDAHYEELAEWQDWEAVR